MAAPAGPSRQPQSSRARNTVFGREEQDLLALIEQLNLEDVVDDTHHPQTDTDLALALLAEDARQLEQFNADRQMALQLAGGNGGLALDTVVVDGHRSLETPATPSSRAPTGASNMKPQGSSWFSAVGSWFSRLLEPSEEAEGAAKVPEKQKTTSNRLTGHNCVVCQDPIRGVEVRAPCGHFYDKDCVLDLFQAATRDESLFPPRCCRQHISFDAVRPHMESAQVNAFLEKRKEFSTMKRVYCAAPACSTFLGAQKSQGTIYECNSSTCKTRTCSFCKAKVDELAHICKKNDSEAEVLSVGQREGWTRCPGCEQMIELIIGCYHMTCRCKTEFCYLCRARWKTCSCPQWDERRLVAAAEARVDRQYGFAPAPAPRVPAPVIDPTPVRPAYVPPVRQYGFAPAPAPAPAPERAAPANPIPARSAPAPAVRSWNQPSRQQTPDEPATTMAMLLAPRPGVHSHLAAAVSRASPSSGPTATRSTSAAAFREGFESHGSRTVHTGKGKERARNEHEFPQKESPYDHRARLVRQAIEDLRVNHDCEHPSWSHRHGGGKCQHCYHHLPMYLFKCRGCEILVCNRCRRNRI